MGVFDKLKNILFEDVEEEEIPVINETKKVEKIKEEKPIIEEEPIEEEVLPKKAEEVSRFKNINYEEDIEEAKKEQELEATSPFQQFDEEEFDRIATINKNRLIERDKKLREEKMEAEHRIQKVSKKEHEIVKEEKKEAVTPKRFTPSPVISPVYGILDKNYKKEDILPRASSDGTLPKIMDVDSVREKAFGVLDDEDEIVTEEVKITSFDDEDTIDEFEEEVETPVVKKRSSKKIEEPIEDEIDDVEEDITEEIEIPDEEKEEVETPVEDTQVEKEKIADEDELESDLFNLIDSMYQDEEE